MVVFLFWGCSGKQTDVSSMRSNLSGEFEAGSGFYECMISKENRAKPLLEAHRNCHGIGDIHVARLLMQLKAHLILRDLYWHMYTKLESNAPETFPETPDKSLGKEVSYFEEEAAKFPSTKKELEEFNDIVKTLKNISIGRNIATTVSTLPLQFLNALKAPAYIKTTLTVANNVMDGVEWAQTAWGVVFGKSDKPTQAPTPPKLDLKRKMKHFLKQERAEVRFLVEMEVLGQPVAALRLLERDLPQKTKAEVCRILDTPEDVGDRQGKACFDSTDATTDSQGKAEFNCNEQHPKGFSCSETLAFFVTRSDKNTVINGPPETMRLEMESEFLEKLDEEIDNPSKFHEAIEKASGALVEKLGGKYQTIGEIRDFIIEGLAKVGAKMVVQGSFWIPGVEALKAARVSIGNRIIKTDQAIVSIQKTLKVVLERDTPATP